MRVFNLALLSSVECDALFKQTEPWLWRWRYRTVELDPFPLLLSI
jgi:hypothetical protein